MFSYPHWITMHGQPHIKLTTHKNLSHEVSFFTPFPTLHFTSLHFTLLYFTLLYFTLLYFTLLYFTLLYFTLLYFTSLHFTFQYELESLIFWRNWSLSLNHCSGLRVFMFLLPLKDIHMLRMHWGGIEGLNYTWTVYWTDDSLRVGSKIQSVVQNVLNFEFWRHSVLLFPLRRRWVNETSGIYLWKSGPWTFTTSCVGR